MLPRSTDVMFRKSLVCTENDDGTFITIEITVLNTVIYVIDIDNFCKQNVPIIIANFFFSTYTFTSIIESEAPK